MEKFVYLCKLKNNRMSEEAGVDLPKAILQWLQGETADFAILRLKYGRRGMKKDWVVEV